MHSQVQMKFGAFYFTEMLYTTHPSVSSLILVADCQIVCCMGQYHMVSFILFLQYMHCCDIYITKLRLFVHIDSDKCIMNVLSMLIVPLINSVQVEPNMYNNPRSYVVPPSKVDQYKHSFFVEAALRLLLQ